jgi:hypothetical protein
MTWNQLHILAEFGMQIASHTIHHIDIGQPPAFTTIQNELVLSKKTLEAQLGQPIQFFCYPSGEPFHHDSVAEQQLVLNDLFSDGYVGAMLDPFSFDSAVQDVQTPYQQSRMRVSGGEDLQARVFWMSLCRLVRRVCLRQHLPFSNGAESIPNKMLAIHW